MEDIIQKATVIFDKNGGDTEPDLKSITIKISDKGVRTLPGAPQKKDHKFNGWNTDPDGKGIIFTDMTSFASDITVYAQWLELSNIIENPSVLDSNASRDWIIEGNTTKIGDDWIYVIDNYSDIPEELFPIFSRVFDNQIPPFAVIYPLVKKSFFSRQRSGILGIDSMRIYFLNLVSENIHYLSDIVYIEQINILLESECIFYFKDGKKYSIEYNASNQNIIDALKRIIFNESLITKNRHINYFEDLMEKSYAMMNRGDIALKNYDGSILYIYKYANHKRGSEVLIILTKTEIIHILNENPKHIFARKIKKNILIKNIKSVENIDKSFIITIISGEKISTDVSNADRQSIDEFIKCFGIFKALL